MLVRTSEVPTELHAYRGRAHFRKNVSWLHYWTQYKINEACFNSLLQSALATRSHAHALQPPNMQEKEVERGPLSSGPPSPDLHEDRQFCSYSGPLKM